MHVTTTGRVMFSGDEKSLDIVSNYLDKIQYGEYFFDDEEMSLVLAIEDDRVLDGRDKIVDYVSRLYRRFKGNVNIYFIGVMTALESECSQKFECQCNENYLRYRESEVDYDYDIAEDLSYEEFEEENNLDVDEDEYDEYVHRAREGVNDGRGDIYGDWDYFDIDL